MSDTPLNAIGFDSSRGVGKHDFVRNSPQRIGIDPSGNDGTSLISGAAITEEEAHKREEEAAKKAAIIEARLKDDRALIFTNLLNGVPTWQVARDFHRSEPDVMNIFRFILRKIKSRRLERMEPSIVGNSISEIQRQRVTVLTILPKLNLDKDPLYRDVFHEPMEIKNDGTLRNADVLRQMKPLPEHLRTPPIAKP